MNTAAQHWNQQQIDAMEAFLTDSLQEDPMNQANQPYANDSHPQAQQYDTGKMDTSTDWRGVYVNTHKNRAEFKYRAAISQNDQGSGKLFWINLGYFHCPLLAAQAYNVAALGIYLGSAKLNRVDISTCPPKEVADFRTKRALRIKIAAMVIEHVKQAGGSLNYVN